MLDAACEAVLPLCFVVIGIAGMIAYPFVVADRAYDNWQWERAQELANKRSEWGTCYVERERGPVQERCMKLLSQPKP